MAVVGGVSSTDPDTGDTASYSIVSGGSDFVLRDGNQLWTARGLTLGDSPYAVRLRVTDGLGLTYERDVVVTVNDINLTPTQVNLADSHVDEHASAGTTVGTLDADDPDAGDTHAFALVAGAGSDDNSSFTIAGSSLTTNAPFDYLTKDTYLIRVRAQDVAGATIETQLTVTVDNVNDPPTALALDSTSVPEGAAVGTTVGTFTPTDPDGTAPYTYALVTGTGDDDNATFAVSDDTLVTGAVFDVDTKSSYSVRVRVTDAGGLSFERAFTITVTDVNEAPTGPTLSDSHVNENAAVPATVGTLASSDPDVGDGATYTLVAGAGSTDNASFQITGTNLETSAVLDFETKASYDIRVRVTDTGGLTSEATFTIQVDDVNDAPVAGDDTFTGAIGNTKATAGTVATTGPKVALTGNLPLANDTDQDPGSVLTIVAGTFATNRGGSVTIAADGSFVYLPKAGDKSLSDHFDYTVRDGVLSDVGRITIPIGSDLVWYVDRSLAAAGAGTSTSPFSSLSSLGGASDPDGNADTIFVYGNATAYNIGLTLETDQQLYGQSVGLTIGGSTLVPAAGSNPTITTGTSVPSLTLATGTYVNGITTTYGVSAPSVNGAVLDTATRLSGTPTAYALSVTGGTSGTIAVKGNITSTSTGRALQVSGRTGGAVDVTGSVTGGAVSLTGNPGTTVTLSGGVNLLTTTESTFVASGGGTVTVTGAANTVKATGWTGLSVTDTTVGPAGLTFKSIDASGGANGIVLTNTGDVGSLTVTGVASAATPGAPGSCGRQSAGDCTGGSLTGTTGSAIALNNTLAPSFSRMCRLPGEGGRAQRY